MRRPSITPLTLLASAIFTGAGTLHFLRPDIFEAIVPRWFPDARAANYASGAAELTLGLGLLPQRTRRWSALGLALLSIIVFPANVDMAVNDVTLKPDPDGTGLIRAAGEASGVGQIVNWARLPLQVPLVWWMWRMWKTAQGADARTSDH